MLTLFDQETNSVYNNILKNLNNEFFPYLNVYDLFKLSRTCKKGYKEAHIELKNRLDKIVEKNNYIPLIESIKYLASLKIFPRCFKIIKIENAGYFSLKRKIFLSTPTLWAIKEKANQCFDKMVTNFINSKCKNPRFFLQDDSQKPLAILTKFLSKYITPIKLDQKGLEIYKQLAFTPLRYGLLKRYQWEGDLVFYHFHVNYLLNNDDPQKKIIRIIQQFINTNERDDVLMKFLNLISSDGTLISNSIFRKKWKVADYLLTFDNLDLETNHPLHLAIIEGNLTITKKILEKKPSLITQANLQGQTPIQIINLYVNPAFKKESLKLVQTAHSKINSLKGNSNNHPVQK